MSRLHRLVQAARHPEVDALIAEGADVNAVDSCETPLELAIHNNDTAMVDLLIRAGADVNQGHPKTGRIPLECAVTQDLGILELLLKAGADVEGGRTTSTPLCIAASFGKREAYERLVAAGANPEATRNGKPAHEILAQSLKGDQLAHDLLALESRRNKPDRYAELVAKMMSEYPTPEEYAAHRGRNIYVFGIHEGIFTDPILKRFAEALAEILRSSERLEECEERFLTGDELETARRERRRSQRWLERKKAREDRIAKAADESNPITGQSW